MAIANWFDEFFKLRKEAPAWVLAAWSAGCVLGVLALWWFLTRGEIGEERILSPAVLPSPAETFGQFKALWFEGALTRNTAASLWRVALGFALAVAIGVPLGVLCGCFTRVNAFFLPVTIFGRNIPIAALIPLTFAFFGTGQEQKVLFIFIACVAFIISDSAAAIRAVHGAYIDTAFTLGASRLQVITKVLVPLALPEVFNTIRILFGLAFGYIMLAELVSTGDEAGGLGRLISISERRSNREWVLLILMVIPLVALAIDRVLFWVQRELFPYRYGSAGYLHRGVRAALRPIEDLAGNLRRRRPPAARHGAGSAP